MTITRDFTPGNSTELSTFAEDSPVNRAVSLPLHHLNFRRRTLMPAITRTLSVFLFLLVLFGTASAQDRTLTQNTTDAPQTNSLASTPAVTATAGIHQVRYVSLGEVQHTRLQVFAPDGTEVFDSDFRLGNLINWQLRDQQGLPLTDGSYLFLVTVKDFSARLTQKYGTATLEQEQVYLQQTARAELPQAQATALDANKQSEVLLPIDRIGASGLARTTTASPDGAFGIDAVPAGKNTTTVNATPGGENISGTGTQNKIAKWTNNTGILGDSTIFEDANGNLGIGTTTPGGVLDLQRNSSTDILQRLFNTGTGGAKLRYVAATGATSQLQLTDGTGWLMAIAGNRSFGMQFRVLGPGGDNSEEGLSASPRMSILPSGNVGIGTTNPQSKLDVAGDLNVTGNAVVAGNIAAKYQDVAEWVQARGQITAGTVVSLDAKLINAVAASHRAYDTHIAGVVSAQPGVILGEGGVGKVMVATTGRVKVRVDASKYPIKIGDLLVTSRKQGVAMRSQPIRAGRALIHRPGTIIGKALEPLANGVGEILVLLSLQ